MSNGLLQRWPAAIIFAALALASAGVSVGGFVDVADRMRHDYGHMTQAQRDDVAVGAAGLQSETWDFIRGHIRPSDRYVIQTPDHLGEGFRRFMQTFAGYWLLPAVAVTKSDDANVLVYISERGPSAAVCLEAPQFVCVLSRRR